MAGRSTSAGGQNYKHKCLCAHQREVVCLNRFQVFYCVECSKVCFETTSCLRVPSFLDSFSIVRDFI